jgi:UDP-N-acetylglucosamine:LPS N-acetylglucosamine transferase
VLAEASVVVTHARNGTVLKALAAGVPLVCVPMGRDQKDNTVRVIRFGAGMRISKKATPNQIAAAVSEILENPNYASAARRSRPFSHGRPRTCRVLPTRPRVSSAGPDPPETAAQAGCGALCR